MGQNRCLPVPYSVLRHVISHVIFALKKLRRDISGLLRTRVPRDHFALKLNYRVSPLNKLYENSCQIQETRLERPAFVGTDKSLSESLIHSLDTRVKLGLQRQMVLYSLSRLTGPITSLVSPCKGSGGQSLFWGLVHASLALGILRLYFAAFLHLH